MGGELFIISKMRQVIRRAKILRVEYYGLKFMIPGLIISIFLLLLKDLILSNHLLLVGVIILGSSLLGVIYGLWRRMTPLDAAKLADRRLGLKERLSSALEFSAQGQESEFKKALIEDAAFHTQGLRVEEVYPHRWPKETKYVVTLLTVVVVLFTLPGFPLLPRRLSEYLGRGSIDEIEKGQDRERLRLEEGVQKEKSLSKMQNLEREMMTRRPLVPGERFGNLSAIFKDTKISKKKPDFSSFLKEGDERLKLLEQLDSIPDLQSDYTQSPYQVVINRMQKLLDSLRLEGLSPDKLKELMEEMERLGSRREEGQLSEEMEGLMEELEKGDKDQTLSALEKTLRKLKSEAEAAKDSKRLGEAKGEGRQRSLKQLGGKQSGEEGLEEKGGSPGEEGSLPGTARSTQTRGESTARIDTPKLDTTLQGERGQGKKESYNTNLLGQGTKSSSHLPYLDVFSQYRKMMEEALTRENIPFDYKEQVREYFHSLER